MKVAVGQSILELQQGDITEQRVTAIVNAANQRLAGGGGVDGAIHRRGGPTIMSETDQRYPEGCRTGSAVISSAGELPAQFVIHAVGPVWSGGVRGEAGLLAGAYRTCFELAAEHDCESVALPALSTGAYGYPIEVAARVALETAVACLRPVRNPTQAIFVLFDAAAFSAFAGVLEQLAREQALAAL